MIRYARHAKAAPIVDASGIGIPRQSLGTRKDGAGRLAWVPVLPADAGAIPLTTPAAITLMPQGRGRLLIDQLNWEWGLKNDEDNTCRIISNLLNNLGIRMMPNISYNAE